MLERDPARRLKADEILERLKALRRPISSGWIAILAASAALVLAGGVYLLRSRGVIADLTRERPARIAILPIDNDTREAGLDALIRVAMPSMLGAVLQDSPKLEVIDAETVAKACETQKIDSHQPLNEAQASRLARALGSQLFFFGSISRDDGRRQDTFSFSLLDPKGRLRHQGTLQQDVQTNFLPNTLLSQSAASLLKAIDPLGAKPLESPYAQLPAPALEAFAQGLAILWKGDYRKAEPFLAQAAYAAPQMARGVAYYARCLQRLSKGEALATSQWALLATQKAKDRSMEAYTLQVIADLVREKGDRALARAYVDRALELSRQARDQDRESSCWKTLGLLSVDDGKLEEAETFFQKALLITQTTGNLRFKADFLTNLANLALTRGDLAQAETRYRDILSANQAMENLSGEALALNNLGVFLLTAQRLDEAEAPLQRALLLRTTIGDGRGEANTLRNLGIRQQMRGAYAEARVLQTRALELSKRIDFALGEAHSLYRLADLDRLEGRFSEGLRGFNAAAELFGNRGGALERADALAAAAECLARSKPPRLGEAETVLAQAHSGPALRTTALRARAWIQFARGHLPAAIQDLEAALRDPEHQAPEGLADLGRTLGTFRRAGVR